MSDWSTVCDAIATELQTNVAGLAASSSLTLHKYERWDPEYLIADRNRHLAVWPAGEGSESAQGLATGADALEQTYVVMVWESGSVENQRLVRDEGSAATFLDLHNAVRARFYLEANRMLGGSALVRYAGCSFPEQIGLVRFFAVAVAVTRYQAYT